MQSVVVASDSRRKSAYTSCPRNFYSRVLVYHGYETVEWQLLLCYVLLSLFPRNDIENKLKKKKEKRKMYRKLHTRIILQYTCKIMKLNGIFY